MKAEIVSLEDRLVVESNEQDQGDTDEQIIQLIDQIAGVQIPQFELDNCITCDDKDSPLIYDEVLE
jgi:hypothetical protein